MAHGHFGYWWRSQKGDWNSSVLRDVRAKRLSELERTLESRSKLSES
jgi:hypothetical protein